MFFLILGAMNTVPKATVKVRKAVPSDMKRIFLEAAARALQKLLTIHDGWFKWHVICSIKC